MPVFGKIVVIKRNGTDGTYFPLTANSCLFGRKKECDIRIQLPQVSKEHCKIEVNENKEAVLFNLSSANPTQLNGNHFQDPAHLKHGDILTIIDRSFRFEYSPPSLPQKRLSKSQEKETLQILQVQHMQQMDLLHTQNSDYKSFPITGKKFETCSPRKSEKRLQKQYSAPGKTNELSPFSKLYELMKHENGTDNVKDNTGNETLLEDVFHSRSRRSAVNRAKLTKIEHSEDSKIQEKSGIVTSPIPVFEEKNSKKSSIQNCDIQQKQECKGTNQSDFHDIEDNEMGKDQIMRGANKDTYFKANLQSAQHFPESHCIVSMDYTKKAKCLNKFNLTDAFTSVENTLSKAKSSRESIQNYSSPCSRNSRRSSKSRRSWVEIDSLNRMKSSGEMEECSVQVSGQEHESGILIGSIYSNKNENRELVTETALNLKDSEDGSCSTVYSSLHFDTSKSCNNNIELNKNISNEYSRTEAIDTVSIITADLFQTSEIVTNQIPERTLETESPTNENKIGIKDHDQNVNMKNDILTFSSSHESSVQTSAKVNAAFEINLLCPLNKSEAKKSPQKRRSKELDFLVQPLGKRKRVSFGGQLSPELFDKRLPPNSPLKKGAIPARLSMPYGNSPRAVLKRVAELRQSVIQGSFERKQYENSVPKQAASQCVSDPHVASLSSEGEETTTQEMHANSLFSEVKQTVSNTTSSLRRSKACTPRRSSIRGKSGAMGTIHSKRRSGASEANLMVAKSWAEVVKQGVPKLQLKSASKQGFKTRSMKNVASKSSKNNNLAKTPKRKISGHFSTGHANSPAPIVIGKAHTGILNVTAQVPKVVINYPLKQHCDLNDSFTGLAEMFCSPSNAKQKRFVPETQITRPEMNASEESEKTSVLDFKISSQKIAYDQDVISPALEEVSQVSIHDNLMISLNERNIMGMEEKKLQQEPEPVRQLLEIKRLLKTPKEKPEPVDVLSGVKRLLRTPKQKSEPVEALSAVKRLLKTPKEKSEPVEVLSGIKRLLRTPKQKSEPVEALSAVKRLLKTPKQKSEPVEDLLGLKRLFKTPKEKSEPVEDLSGVKRLLETPELKSEAVEVFSRIKTLKTSRQTVEPLLDDIYTKSMITTEEVKNMVGSVIRNQTQPMEDTHINDIIEKVKQTVRPIEDRENIQMMSPELVGCTQTLKTSKPKSMPTDDYFGLQKFMIEPKESSVIPDIDYTGVKDMNTESDTVEMPESVNLVEENGSYISSRNKVESVENVPGSCKGNLEIAFEKESQFPVTKNNSSVPNYVGHVACNSFNELKTEFNKETIRAISLSENYQPDGISSKNEAKTDFVNEAAENSDALKTEKLEPLALARTRRRKINDCSPVVYTKTIQRPTKSRSTSANCEQISESFDNHTELNSLHKSESNCTTIEATKLSRRGRPKKQHVERNRNIESDNINHTQELEKPLKETTVEKQPVNRQKAATKRKGETVTNVDLEENGPVQENESDLTAKTRLRSRNVKKNASDLKTTFAKGKTNDTMSGEESNKRRKIAVIQLSPETLITTLNEDKQGGQKCTISKICKTEASENNLTAMEENLVKKKKKTVQFLLNDFKASEQKCALGYEGNTYEEESQTENISNGIPKVPLESMKTSTESSPPKIEKLSKKNLPSRGRGKKSVSSPSVESDSKSVSDVKDHDMIVSLKENQPKRGRGRKIVQVFPKPFPLENNTFGEKDSTINKCLSSQGGCSLLQVQNENFEKSEMLPLENGQRCEGHIPPKRVVKENPPRRGRNKQVNEISGNEAADVQGLNMATRQEDNQSKRARGKRNAEESCSLKSQRIVKESPPRRGKHKKTISGDISTDFDSTQMATILDQNIDGENACLAKDDQSKVGGRTRSTCTTVEATKLSRRGRPKKQHVVSQKIPSVKSDTCNLLSSNKGEHSGEHPNEDLKSASNANENFTYKCRKRKIVHEISANSVSSSKKSEFIDNDIQVNRKKDSKAVSKQSTSRSKRKRLTPCETSAESNDELRINSKKSQPVTDIVGPLENSFEKKRQSKKQKEETNIVSLVSPSLKVNITLSPSSAAENQSGNCKNSVGTRKLAKLSGTHNIMTRSLKGKCIISKEEFVHETQNKDLQQTVTATVINRRRGRRKINKLEAAVSPLKEKLTLSAGSDNFPNEQILNNVSNNKISSKGKGPKFLEIKNMTQNINQSNSSNYDQNKNLKHPNMPVQKSSSERGKRKQINSSETITTANMVKNVIPGKKSTVSKAENTESITVQTRGKKKMKEENTILMIELPRETEGRTRASKRIRK
ncbi:proliferation marker protein Ki-67 [Crotalus tigris]|uniref:proliferation marker protein Ki-67 n=1 Tax=Crotalus tigris TaxID=88082 RepID=UPI00192FA674|nr:proliferation marker protein Ki-67 [Crotalus tigris]XP_039202015.1 proliferation marker protein Ki-67 [Crotalus tigris]XP_039202101.1 proliferation marker protein Ki-67 [Crotalus tigris]XP_039202193.1 proliferation marker protein Ki-67 [Crotalus tigris]XP_039202272.1 proliferation marker protein Ki-67 [Crotalus tigris]XP_039202358.1 proliferation marker protein Ki-67 [Crotalus tigris]XP_039202444.1 proliferation marker protein Ki-67 [Crotalus tigris]XP_039202519.1 proliferation marker pro